MGLAAFFSCIYLFPEDKAGWMKCLCLLENCSCTQECFSHISFCKTQKTVITLRAFFVDIIPLWFCVAPAKIPITVEWYNSCDALLGFILLIVNGK